MSFFVNGDSIAGPNGCTCIRGREQGIGLSSGAVYHVQKRRSGLLRIKKLFCKWGFHKWSPWMKRIKMGSILYFYRRCLRCPYDEEDWLKHPYIYDEGRIVPNE